jgi:TolB-like protein/DNA-binding winged helix-turn-helix (wHTH) protein/Tfp pilus assembly protein PilF
MNGQTTPAEMAANRLRLGEFVLDRAAGELFTADGQLAGLRKQALDVLVVLSRRPGQVVGKDELMRLVWPNVVVGEGSLTQAIADIRRVLGDGEHRMIRNVARRGYMLVPETLPAGAIERLGVDSAPSAPAAAPDAGARAWPLRWMLAVIIPVVLIATGAWVTGLIRSEATPSWHTPTTLARAPLPRDVPPLSIIVLPLAIDGGAKDMEWFADALHGDLVIEVARLHNSLVIARDTAATYKGKAVDPRQVAREMGVRHVVSGSLRQEGAKVVLNLALIDGETGVQRWAETFTTERAALAQAVGDFAVAIERTLAGQLFRSTVERRSALSPTEVTADDLAMQGYALWYRGVTRENVAAARELFERAVVMDPDSARAFAGINFTANSILLNSWAPDRAAQIRRVEQASAQLERLDRDGHYTYNARALQLFLKRDFPALLQLTSEWIERYRLPLSFGAHGAALNMNGRFDDAVAPLERALRLSPRDPFRFEWQFRLAMAHFGAGRYELARDWSQAAATSNPAALFPPIHAAALHRLGRLDEAQRAFDEHMHRHPEFTSARIAARMPSDDPAFAEMRRRLVESLRALGMRD